MKRILIPLSVAALLVSACTVNIGTSGSPSESTGGSSATQGSAPSTDSTAPAVEGGSSAPAASSSLEAKAGLANIVTMPGDTKQLVTYMAADGDKVFATILDTTKEDDADLGLLYSTDGGATWQNSGVLSLPDNQYARGLTVTPQGVVIVGVTAVTKGDKTTYSALLASAAAPDYQLKNIPAGDAFKGNISTAGIEYVDGTIVVGGSIKKASKLYEGNFDSTPVLWATQDGGATWVKKEITVKGSSDTSVDVFAIAPDGSWNMVGQGYPLNNGTQQFSAAWLKSTDGGDTWALQHPDLMDESYDQGATDMAFTDDSKIGITGWDEQKERGDDISVLWTDSVGDFQRLGGRAPIPVADGAMKGDFLNGIAGYDGSIIVWGSSTGTYPTSTIRFWKVTASGLETLYDLTDPTGNDVYVATAIPFNGGLLVGGSVGENRDAALWFGKM